MRNMPMCPMMMAQMQAMPMMQQPMQMSMPMENPMCMQMPMMTQMPMMEEGEHDEDEKDEEYFAGMYGENCHMMMPYVMKTVDKMEQKGDMIYDEYPEQEMVSDMTDEAYKNMIKDMPEMADESENERQYGRRRVARDLLGILLINELLRRRRRRRHNYDFYDHDYNHHGDEFGDFYYYD